jgi:hypothetical protein
MRVSARVAAISGPRSDSALLSLLVLSRIPAIDAWLRSLSKAVSRSVSVVSRSSNCGALDRSAPRPPGLAGISGTPNGQALFEQSISGRPACAPSSWTVDGPVKLPWIAAVVPSRIGVLSSTDTRTRTNSGDLASSLMSLTWPIGTPEKLTADPLASPSTDCLNRISYSRLPSAPKREIHTMNKASTASRINTTPPTST